MNLKKKKENRKEKIEKKKTVASNESIGFIAYLLKGRSCGTFVNRRYISYFKDLTPTNRWALG